MGQLDKWIGVSWTDELLAEFKKEMAEAVTAKVESRNNKLVNVLNRGFVFACVVENETGTKWMEVRTPDVREDPEWHMHLKLRRMSSSRDWKGDALHECPYTEVEDYIVRYFADEYDEEIY